MKRLIFALLLLSGMITAEAQRAKELEQPKLVVGLMVDQMRWDYLTRYADIYCDGGFNRLSFFTSSAGKYRLSGCAVIRPDPDRACIDMGMTDEYDFFICVKRRVEIKAVTSVVCQIGIETGVIIDIAVMNINSARFA